MKIEPFEPEVIAPWIGVRLTYKVGLVPFIPELLWERVLKIPLISYPRDSLTIRGTLTGPETSPGGNTCRSR